MRTINNNTTTADNSGTMSALEVAHMRYIDSIKTTVGEVNTAHSVLHSGRCVPNRFGIVYDAAESLLCASLQLIYLSNSSTGVTRERALASAKRLNESALKYVKILEKMHKKRDKYSTEQLLPALRGITQKLLPIAAQLGVEAAPWLGEFTMYPDEASYHG